MTVKADHKTGPSLNGHYSPPHLPDVTPGRLPYRANQPTTDVLTLEQVLATRITEESHIPDVVPTITVKNGTFAIQGDISFISGAPKSGKSSLCQFILSTALMETIPDAFDTLGIQSIFCQNRPVVYIDTEQPPAYTNRMLSNVKRLIGATSDPGNLFVYNWRNFSHTQNRTAIEYLFKQMPDTFLWIIDGITDFVAGANEEREGNEAIRFFMQQASELNTTVVLLIHETPNTGKMRGHIGSEAERKCGGALSIKKDRDNGVHWIEPKLIRGSSDFEKYAFRYDDGQSRFVSVDDSETRKIKAQMSQQENRQSELHRLAVLVFDGQERLARKDVSAGLQKHIPQKPNQSPEAYRKAIARVLLEMVDNYNILTPFGEQKDTLRYLSALLP